MTTKTTRKPKAAAETPKADNAALTANAPDSTSAKVGAREIPPPPSEGDGAQAGELRKGQQATAGANGQFEEPGSTLNPSDPSAPNYRFQQDEETQRLAGDQSIDQGTGVQPPSPVIHAIPAGGGTQEAEDGLVWGDEVTARGRVISVTKGKDGPTLTGEEVLPAGATDAQAAAAKERLQRRFAA